jgi:hypothetical protein
MKTTKIISFIFLIFLIISCNQATRKQAKTANNEIFVERKENKSREYDEVRSFRSGLAAVQLDGKWGFIDRDSNEVIPLQFFHAWDFQGNFAQVRLEYRGETYHIDRTGTLISRDSVVEFYRQEFLERFCIYPFISPNEIARIAPVIRSWTDFYNLDLAQFRLVSVITDICINCPINEDGLKYFNFRENEDFSDPEDISIEFSPNKQMYLSWIGGVFYDEGNYHHIGWDDSQNVWLYDLNQRHAHTVIWNGTSSLTEVAFWKSNDVFIVVGYTQLEENLHTITIFDMKNNISARYEIIANTADFRYLPEVFFKERGIIADW